MTSGTGAAAEVEHIHTFIQISNYITYPFTVINCWCSLLCFPSFCSCCYNYVSRIQRRSLIKAQGDCVMFSYIERKATKGKKIKKIYEIDNINLITN